MPRLRRLGVERLRFRPRSAGYTGAVAEEDTPGGLVEEVDRGRSERTPFLAISGVTLVVGAVVAVLIVVLFLVYYLV